MKTLKVAALAAVVVLALAVAGVSFAFAQAPWGRMLAGAYGMMGNGYGMMSARKAGPSGTPVPGYGTGMMTGDYEWMYARHGWGSANAGMHTAVWNGLAKALDLTPDQLDSQLAEGKTLAQIAEAQGVSQAELAVALEVSLKAGLEQAVADGALTQAQADQMLSRMAGQYEWMLSHMSAGSSFGPGGCHGRSAPQATALNS